MLLLAHVCHLVLKVHAHAARLLEHLLVLLLTQKGLLLGGPLLLLLLLHHGVRVHHLLLLMLLEHVRLLRLEVKVGVRIRAHARLHAHHGPRLAHRSIRA